MWYLSRLQLARSVPEPSCWYLCLVSIWALPPRLNPEPSPPLLLPSHWALSVSPYSRTMPLSSVMLACAASVSSSLHWHDGIQWLKAWVWRETLILLVTCWLSVAAGTCCKMYKSWVLWINREVSEKMSRETVVRREATDFRRGGQIRMTSKFVQNCLVELNILICYEQKTFRGDFTTQCAYCLADGEGMM